LAPAGAGLLANAMRAGSAGWRLGGGSRQPSRPNQVFKKERLSAAATTIKKFRVAALPSLSRTALEKRRQNFGAGKILLKQNRYFEEQDY